MPADGGERISLSNDSWASALSLDGKLVVYLQRVGGSVLLWKISITPFAGGEPLQMFNVTSESRPSSRWTPDGRAIIYIVTHGGVSGVTNPWSTLAADGIFSGVTNLWMQPLDGGPPKQLTNFASESFFALDWSRDGKLVYGRGETPSDAVLITDFR